MNNNPKPETLVSRAADIARTSQPVTRREAGSGCDGNSRIKDDKDSLRNRFYAAYRSVRFQRRFG